MSDFESANHEDLRIPVSLGAEDGVHGGGKAVPIPQLEGEYRFDVRELALPVNDRTRLFVTHEDLPAGVSPLRPHGGQDPTSQGTWPNLFLVGAVRAGTTSLHYYLSQHPQIFMSPVKEPHFFSKIDLHGYKFDESSYLRLFAGSSGEKIRGESSPLYLWDDSTPQRIKTMCPNAKIIILLRHPVTRAYSHYLMDVQAGVQKLSFLEAIKRELDQPLHLYIELGKYCHQVTRYLEVFTGSVLVIVFEEFIADVRAQMKDVFGFLDVDAGYAALIDLRAHNEYRGPLNVLGKAAYGAEMIRSLGRRLLPPPARAGLRRSLLAKKRPGIDREAQTILNDAYKDELDCLRRLLGREVPWELAAA